MSTADTENWLAQLGTTLWADWDVTDGEQRRKAAEWFEKQIGIYEDYLMEKYERTTAPNDDAQAIWEHDVVAAFDAIRYGWKLEKRRRLPPPAKGTHESDLRDHIEYGPTIDGLPGTGPDETFNDARDWSRS